MSTSRAPLQKERRSPDRREKRITATEIYALVFGLFLGLAIVKFGNPVILDQVIEPPKSLSELLHNAWPVHWANWLLAILALAGAALALSKKPRWPATRWLWILPLIWFGWQLMSATQTEDRHLTIVTLCQLGGCVICYFLGALIVGTGRGWNLVMIGVLAAFTFCLMRAVQQKFFEYGPTRQFLLDSQQMGWTNLPPETVQEMKRDNAIINTNGVDIANPAILEKYEKGRVQGTMFYPNTLAGIVLLLLPMALVNVFAATHNLRRWIYLAAMALMAGLGAVGMFGSGSKGGWLIALAAGVVWLLRLNWSSRLKWLVVSVLLAGGLIVFTVRFHNYFARGATSVGARFDYWRVAARVSIEKPLFGTGPGTFQRPYERMKQPEAEMARLVHNDYLEQFSDSGLIGGAAYLAWIGSLLWLLTRRLWLDKTERSFDVRCSMFDVRCSQGNWLPFAVLLGLLAWFVQGLMEFSLYVPALAWTAFTLAGCLLRRLQSAARTE